MSATQIHACHRWPGRCLVVCCAVLGLQPAGVAQPLEPPRGESQGLFAEPQLASDDPFKPTALKNVELPVALSGFSAVALRDQQQWVSGERQFQLVFDGQIYWFAGPRDRDIFTAAPHEYAPVLAGDCVVTYVDTGKRVMGKLEYALLQGRRLFLFAGPSEREQFRRQVERYVDGDLAHQGKCLVSRVDHGREVQGLPETVAVVNGLRYLFVGAYQRSLFAEHMGHYGVERQLKYADEGQPGPPVSPPGNAAPQHSVSPYQNKMAKQAKPLPKQSEVDLDAEDLSMEGYCPVSIQQRGVWIHGSYRNSVQHKGKVYLLAGDQEKKMFVNDPERYAPVLGGNCVVSKVDTGKDIPGSIYHAIIDSESGKLYLLASPEQALTFKANPAKYLQSEDPAETLAEEEKVPAAQKSDASDPNTQ